MGPSEGKAETVTLDVAEEANDGQVDETPEESAAAPVQAPTEVDADDLEFLSFEDILTQDDLKYKDVIVPEWAKNGKPGVVRLRTMDGDERDHYVQTLNSRMAGTGSNRQVKNYKNLTIILLQMTMIKKDGSPLMTKKQCQMMQKKNGDVIDRLYKKSLTLNGLREEDIEIASKNSETGRNGDAGITLPSDDAAL